MNPTVDDPSRATLLRSFEDRVCYMIEKRTNRAQLGTISLLCETTAGESHIPPLIYIRSFDQMRDGRSITTHCLACEEEDT